ncbi:MAG: hypothetical protein ACOX7G_00385 [Candidatus Scatomorpha sp.]|jgi:hypothetical protein
MSDMKRTASTARRRGRIRLMDRCLLAYMAILLAQSAYSLFSAAALSTETSGIDIIVRTSTAAIFGYFLSANYRLEAAPGEDGLDDPGNRLQVATTAGIGLFCLLTLLAFRAAALRDPGLAASDSATATLAQLRDFVSGCVGCLIASPAAKSETTSAIT